MFVIKLCEINFKYEFEDWMGEGSGWVMGEISTISLKIARMKY